MRSGPIVAMAIAVLSIAGAEAQTQRGRSPGPPTVEPCDLLGQPTACTACPAVMAALRLPGAPIGDSGQGSDGIVWSPLFVAFRINCQDAGRLLLSRGANPERGGKDGALLAEVAAQHFAPGSRSGITAAIEWIDLLAKTQPFDLDESIGDGLPSTRQSWVAAQSAGPLPSGAMVVWSRIEAASANFPIVAGGGDRTNVDFPASDTGVTRPSETAVSRGVEAALATYEQGGMIGLTARVQACWSEARPPDLPPVRWRWHLDNCAALDLAAATLDADLAPKIGVERQAFFLDDLRLPRMAPLTQTSGVRPVPYARSLRRSVETWLPIQYAIRAKG